MVQLPNNCDIQSLLSLKLISFCLERSALGEWRQISSSEQGQHIFTVMPIMEFTENLENSVNYMLRAHYNMEEL